MQYLVILKKRKQYDQFGHAAFEGGAGGAGGFDFSGMDFGDIFGDIFGDFFGGGTSRRGPDNGPRRGANLRARVRITFEEAVFGCEKQIEITLKMTVPPVAVPVRNREQAKTPVQNVVEKEKLCTPSSHSLVWYRMYRPVRNVVEQDRSSKKKCKDCHGTGYIAKRKKISVMIPAGIDNGQSVRIRDKGEPGINGGPRGDLLVEVMISGHPIFQRQDTNLYSTAPILFCTGSTWWRSPYQYHRWGCLIRCETGNTDRHKNPVKKEKVCRHFEIRMSVVTTMLP